MLVVSARFAHSEEKKRNRRENFPGAPQFFFSATMNTLPEAPHCRCENARPSRAHTRTRTCVSILIGFMKMRAPRSHTRPLVFGIKHRLHAPLHLYCFVCICEKPTLHPNRQLTYTREREDNVELAEYYSGCPSAMNVKKRVGEPD